MTPTTTQPRRDNVLDILKFVAIFMVVNGHTYQYSGSDIASLDMAFIKFSTITQMPLFAFISGYVSFRSITTQPLWRGTLKSRWYSLIRPMIIFCLIWAVINLIFYIPKPIGAWEIVDATLFSIKSSYWFIWIVIYCIILGYLATKWGGILYMLLLIALLQVVPDSTSIPPFIGFLKAMLPFFFGGMLFKQHNLFDKLKQHKLVSMMIAATILAIGYALYRGSHTFYFFPDLSIEQHIAFYALMQFAGFASIIICYFIAHWIDQKVGNSRMMSVVKYLGGFTFAIYMLQGLVFAIMRQHAINIESQWMQLLLSLSIFTTLCLLVFGMSKSRLLSRLLLGKMR